MPDTTTPYRLAYTLIALLYGGYSLSLWLRARRAERTRRTRR